VGHLNSFGLPVCWHSTEETKPSTTKETTQEQNSLS